MDFGSVGIVLKRLSFSGNKIALLDKKYGRIECITPGCNSAVGSLLEYTIVSKNALFLKNIQFLYAPLSLGGSDLLFLHHIIELIYYFAPEGSQVSGVFDLLAFLYTIEHMLISMKFKKFFLLKLLILLGATPDIETISSLDVPLLHAMTLYNFDESMMNTQEEKKIDVWLWSCIIQHPCIDTFKTIHFLEKNRVL